MRKKTVISLLMALTLALTACGQQTTSNKESTTSESKKETVKESTTSESTASETEEELEYVKLIYLNGNAKPATGNYDKVWAKINEMLLEDINCEIEVQFLGSLDKSALSLKYAGNEKFDMAFDASWLGHTDNAAANAYRAITREEIHEYMPLIEEQLPEVAWEQVAQKGNIYLIPCIYEGWNEYGVVVRGDLRKKYDIEPLETLDDFYEYLKATAAEPGMEAYTSHSMKGGLMNTQEQNWHSLSGLGVGGIMYDLDDALNGQGEVFCSYATEEYAEYCKKMKELADAGCWAPDAISASTDHRAAFENGMSASYSQNILTLDEVCTTLEQTHPDWKCEVYYLQEGHPMMNSSFLGDGTTINRNSENAERAMMAINLLYGDPEYNHLLQYGFEGVNYKINADGLMEALDASEADTYVPGVNWNFMNNVIGLTSATQYAGISEIFESFKENTVASPYTTFSFDQTNVAAEFANLKAVTAEYKALEYGMIEDIEGTIEQFVADLKAAGLQTVLDEANRQLAEYMAKK